MNTRKLRRLIKNYADWQETRSWSGGGDPESIPRIEKQYKLARKKLFAYLRELELCELITPQEQEMPYETC